MEGAKGSDGANLPQAVIDEFEDQIGNPEWFSGSDTPVPSLVHIREIEELA